MSSLGARMKRSMEARRARFHAKRKALRPSDLVYAATARCQCGAGLAYMKGSGPHAYWDCSDILLGKAVESGQPGAKTHTGQLPFVFYAIKSEIQPSANGMTTRPA